LTFVIAHITDTHLSREKPFFLDNFRVAAEHLRAQAPDLVVNTGDVSLNGADIADDMREARLLHDGLGLPWRAIPGNHDVGDNQEVARKQPANRERRERWTATFGADFWTQDVPGWRLLGVNSLLLGSDIPEAAEQDAFIRDAVARLDGRSLLLFTHKPLFNDSPNESDATSHFFSPSPRSRLFDLLGAARPAIVACGHLHEHRERDSWGMRQVWAPAISFTIPDWYIAPHGGVHTVGYVRIALEDDGRFETRLIQPEGLVVNDLADFPQAYGDLRQHLAERAA
jgi:3',5'-cyclic AMP phosphodiesterase CpdA